ncbi:hypothetical protein E6C76_07415 [Pseudothauera nasutitermitis]|uniref:Carboxysome Shell Carbonic Anhydrase catalytic domain-containing protein n=1 Tax=Pseudothauera nasutitermitis TaxID=2565930 RepID=A0A4S4AZ40_9RHOO|nr:carboxysome shell carbonic anhydrase domain-containg protein [Pseudothauera nasutitermitis]THF65421.1 hypothetical protein E6C76_07415 [Pseudothauera nasutitermitis]
MALHEKPIGERIDWLFGLARQHAAEFASPETQLARARYLAEHPTAIMALKCMDGRINIAIATRTPRGIVQPFRNLGGMFNLGWPHLGEVLAEYVQDIVHDGRRALALVTYHYSKGDPARGCAGFAFDTAAAREHTFAIRRQFEQVFGGGHGTVYPLVCGFETDEEALVLHADSGETLDVAALAPDEAPWLRQRLARLFPDMPGQVLNDLVPLVEGNLAHVAATRGRPRELDIEHREWTICLGRGFDFLHTPNLALIIGPYSPDLGDPVRKAAGIIQANMDCGRIPPDGFLLLASAPYVDPGMDRARAELKARFLSDFAAGVIAEAQPELAARMHVHTAVLDWRTRALTRLPD